MVRENNGERVEGDGGRRRGGAGECEGVSGSAARVGGVDARGHGELNNDVAVKGRLRSGGAVEVRRLKAALSSGGTGTNDSRIKK